MPVLSPCALVMFRCVCVVVVVVAVKSCKAVTYMPHHPPFHLSVISLFSPSVKYGMKAAEATESVSWTFAVTS